MLEKAVFGQVIFKDVRKLAAELSLLESKVKLYEEELINLRSTRYTLDSIIGKNAPKLRVAGQRARIIQCSGKNDGVPGRQYHPPAGSTLLPASQPQKKIEINQSSLKDVQARTEKEAIRYALNETMKNKARAAIFQSRATHMKPDYPERSV